MTPAQAERIMLGFACGLAFNYVWWESWISGLVAATWIMQTGQIGNAEFYLQERGQSWRKS